MQFRARFFDSNPSDDSLICNTRAWKLHAPDHAPGRVMVQKAMRAACWPDVSYSINYRRRDNIVDVEIDIPEKPYQFLTLTVEDPANWYDLDSFRYMAPVKTDVADEAASRIAMLAIFCLCLASLLITVPRHLYFSVMNPRKAKGIAVALDRAANGALNGNHNETISSRANRARAHHIKWGCVLCKVLDWFKKGHCRDSAGK